MAKDEERQPGELRVGDKVNTPNGTGKITSMTDTKISVDLDSKQKGEFAPRYVERA